MKTTIAATAAALTPTLLLDLLPEWQRALRATAWLLATEQLLGDPFVGIKGPVQRQKTVIPLRDDELRALIRTCTHPTQRPYDHLHHRRDEALIRLMLETGIRAGEAVGLELRDLELHVHRITIRNGKGGRERTIPVGPTTVEAIRGYLLERKHHPPAASRNSGTVERGDSFGYDGLNQALRRRARLAGIDGFHLHKPGTPQRTAGWPAAARSPG